MKVRGGGPHQCSGRVFVTSQIKMIVASFVLLFDMDMRSPFPAPVPRNGLGTMRLGKEPIMVDMTPR